MSTIEVRSAGREIVAWGPDGEEILIGHVFREGDRLVPVILPKFVGNSVAERVMAHGLSQTTLADFSLIEPGKGAA